MNKIAIDVICPVYNAEKTISRCIDSVLAQRHQNWKLILIDDGSKDNTAEIMKKYAKDYPDKIFYFYQENTGLSGARNLGLKNSFSPYFCFLDSDDYIDADWLESFNLGAQKGADIVFNGYTRTKVLPNEEFVDVNVHSAIVEKNNKEGLDVLAKFNNLQPLLRNLAATSLFKREIVINNGLFFKTKMIPYEDMYFKREYLKFCKNIECMYSSGYHYVYYPTSLANIKRESSEFFYLYDAAFDIEQELLKIFQYNKEFDRFSKRTYFIGSANAIVCSKKLGFVGKLKETQRVLSRFCGYISYLISPLILIGFIIYKNRRLVLKK